LIKWIVFDMMGVIFEEGDTMSTVLFPFVNEQNNAVSREEVNSLYIKGRVGTLTSRQIFEALGFKDEPRKAEEGFLRKLKLDPGFKPAAEKLKTKYKLGVLSNDVSEWSGNLRKMHKLDGLFDAVVISGDAALHKPQKEIFEFFLKKSGVKAGECVFVDDKVRNLIPAEAMGFKTIKFIRAVIEGEIWSTEIRSFKELGGAIEEIQKSKSL